MDINIYITEVLDDELGLKLQSVEVVKVGKESNEALMFKVDPTKTLCLQNRLTTTNV